MIDGQGLSEIFQLKDWKITYEYETRKKNVQLVPGLKLKTGSGIPWFNFNSVRVHFGVHKKNDPSKIQAWGQAGASSLKDSGSSTFHFYNVYSFPLSVR